ncbi:MAG: DUF1579 family protein [Planctomycetota bacterium]
MMKLLPLIPVLLWAGACASPAANSTAADSTAAGDPAIAPPLPPPTQSMDPFLARFVGEWEHSAEFPNPAGGDPMVMLSRETISSVGPWMTSTIANADMGFEARITLTRDPETGRYRGTWVDSSGPLMWSYDGWVDGETLILEAEGPSMADPTKTAMYRDTTRFEGDDTRIGESFVQNDDGTWTKFNEAVGRRVR